LIAAGLAPAAMITCVPMCSVGQDERECQKCIDRVLKEEGEEGCEAPAPREPAKEGSKEAGDPADDSKERDTPTLCTMVACPEGNCGRGS
jgi:hypothetical protein